MAGEDPYAGLGVQSAIDPYEGLGVGASAAPAAPKSATDDAIANIKSQTAAGLAKLDETKATVRGNIVKGLADLAGAPAAMSNLTSAGIRALYKHVTGDEAPHFFDDSTVGTPQYFEGAAKSAGLPVGTPAASENDPTQRYIGAATRGAVGAIAPEAMVPGAIGAIASQGVQDAGGGPMAQTAAGLVGGVGSQMAPTLAKRGLQGALGVNPEVAQQNISNAEALGASPTVGQAAGPGSNAQVIEKGLSYVPGAAGVVKGSIEASNKAAAQTVSDIAGNLGGDIGPQAMGAATQDSIKKNALPAINKAVSDAFIARAAKVPAGTTVDIEPFLRKVDELADKDPNFERYIKASPTYQRILERLKGNEQAAGVQTATIGGQKVYIKPDGTASTTPPAGDMHPGTKLDFTDADGAVQQLNGLVDHGFTSGENTSQVNGALSQAAKALNESVSKTLSTIPAAKAADTAANALYQQALNAKGKLRAVLNAGTPEKAAQALMSGAKDGDSILDASMRGLPVSDQNVVSGSIISRLGKTSAGTQDAEGAAWSAATFLTNWNKLSDGARATLFRNLPPTVRTNMDTFAAYAENIKKSQAIYANPSGTASASKLIATASGVSSGLTAAGTMALKHPLIAAGVAASTIAPIALAYGSAKLMTNPNVVRWLAASTKLPPTSVPIIASQLAQLGAKTHDPEIQGLAKAVSDKYAANDQGQQQP